MSAWLLVSSFGAPPNRIASNICENSFIYIIENHEVDSVNMSNVPKRFFLIVLGRKKWP